MAAWRSSPTRPSSRTSARRSPSSYLAGDSTVADAQVHDGSFYADHAIELRASTRAIELDPDARRLALSDGEQLAYDALLIATGATPRRPPIDGADGDRVFVLRSLADADALRAAICPGGHTVIVGAGWIGCEVAATARRLGAEVTLIEHGSVPLERVLGLELGGFFADLHRGRGVELIARAGVASIERGGRAVRLAGGQALDCDAVLLAVGVAPATGLAAAAGLAVDDGIVTDDRLRTCAPSVFAAGDVASVMHSHYGRRIRVEHWDAAAAQGAAVARSMLGKGQPYAKLPYFFSDQYDLGFEYVGRHDPGDDARHPRVARRRALPGALGLRRPDRQRRACRSTTGTRSARSERWSRAAPRSTRPGSPTPVTRAPRPGRRRR